MVKKIRIVGIGMDGEHTLTYEAEKAVQNAQLLIGAERMLKPFEGFGKSTLCEYKAEVIAEHIVESTASSVVVLMSGDCGFYSGADRLLRLLKKIEGADIEVVCGIASPVYFCSRIGIPWNDMHFVSLHGRNANIARIVSAHEKAFFLLGGNVMAAELCQKLCEYGLNDAEMYIGEELASENERIFHGKAAEFTELRTSKLCVAVAVNSNYEGYRRSGIDDIEFIRGDIPMTKSEVRSIVISKLEIAADDVCWDIGSGTGSVSVEMAIQCESGMVYAVEKNNVGVELIRQNSIKFHCDNICIINGNASEKVCDLPVPDCVFIGGSGGELEEIIQAAYAKNNAVKIVLTAVTLETLEIAVRVFDMMGFIPEITQVAITRTRRVGGHTMLSAENPVFVIKRKIS